MSKKQNNKPTVGDAFGHLTGFFKTTGLLAVRGVSESAHLVANTADRAFAKKKKKAKSRELDINKVLKRIEKNFAKLEQRDLELADHITTLQTQRQAKAQPTAAKPAKAKPVQPAKAKTTKAKPVKITATM